VSQLWTPDIDEALRTATHFFTLDPSITPAKTCPAEGTSVFQFTAPEIVAAAEIVMA